MVSILFVSVPKTGVFRVALNRIPCDHVKLIVKLACRGYMTWVEDHNGDDDISPVEMMIGTSIVALMGEV